MCRRTTFSILSLLLVGLVCAQDKPSFKLFCPDNNYQPFGLFVGAGMSIASADTEQETYLAQVSNTTSYQMTLKPRGKVGLGGELGGLFFLRRSFIRMIDFGFNYRQVAGAETLQGSRTPGGDLSYPDLMVFEGDFKYHRASFRLNAQSVIPIGYTSYIHLGPGLFIDETLGQKNSYDTQHIVHNTEIPDKPSLTAINFMMGFGVRLGERTFLNLYTHAPVLSLTGGKGFNTREEIYNSSYSFDYLGLRLIWVKATPSRECPATSRGGSRLGKKKLHSDFYPW